MPDIRRTRKTTNRKGVRIGSRIERIRIPQSEKRPIRIRSGDILRESLIREDPKWFVTHRRGVYRPTVGMDPMEARAVKETSVRGYLHERVVYRWLTVAGFQPGVDFDFQSSQEGGRLELGGMVVDFLFHWEKIALSVLGPTHEAHLRKKKDEEQESILRDMGYWPYSVTIEMVQDEFEFNRFMMRLFVYRDLGTLPIQGIESYRLEEDEIYDNVYEEIDAGIGDIGSESIYA